MDMRPVSPQKGVSPGKHIRGLPIDSSSFTQNHLQRNGPGTKLEDPPAGDQSQPINRNIRTFGDQVLEVDLLEQTDQRSRLSSDDRGV